jgi:hypothetical protein
MASISCGIHLHADDQPYLQQLESGAVAICLEGKHTGPTLFGRDDSLVKLRDAIDAYLIGAGILAKEAA